MQTEIEAKFPDINLDEMRAKLQTVGGVLLTPERLMRRRMFDYEDDRMDDMNAWLRVRDEGDRVTVSYKRVMDRSLHGTKEVSLVVDSFEKSCEFFEAIGLQAKAYQETKRETWDLDGCEVTLDTWPWIPSFVEIEASSEEAVRSAAEKLGLDWKHATHGSVETVYRQHYDVTEKEIDHWESITFIPVPEWLEKTRKNGA